MATITLGTAATSTLTALAFSKAAAAADVATIALRIKNDLINGNPVWPGAFSLMGLLYIPNRGVLQLRDGDVVGTDATGWPILLSPGAAAGANWVHS